MLLTAWYWVSFFCMKTILFFSVFSTSNHPTHANLILWKLKQKFTLVCNLVSASLRLWNKDKKDTLFFGLQYHPKSENWNKRHIKCYEAKIEESEKAGSYQESNPGHFWLELPLSYANRTTTSHHNPLSIFRLITSKFLYFQREARCSEQKAHWFAAFNASSYLTSECLNKRKTAFQYSVPALYIYMTFACGHISYVQHLPAK